MTKINPYWIVKQAKSTEIVNDSEYPDWASIYAKDTYKSNEVPFFNKYWIPTPIEEPIHITEIGLPLIGGLLGAYAGKGWLNKLKYGLLGTLAGAGVQGIGTFTGARARLFPSLMNTSLPIYNIGTTNFIHKRLVTPEEKQQFIKKHPEYKPDNIFTGW